MCNINLSPAICPRRSLFKKKLMSSTISVCNINNREEMLSHSNNLNSLTKFLSTCIHVGLSSLNVFINVAAVNNIILFVSMSILD